VVHIHKLATIICNITTTMRTAISAVLTILPIVSAHFVLKFPAARSDDDAQQATFPCGGHDVVGTRTPVPLNSLGLNMELGHTENTISVFLAIGNEPGDAFNTVLWPTVSEMGPGDFCWESIAVPGNLSIEAGTNATIQVITNAHDGGGLYNVSCS
jgi:nascent polypeptide-associated complex subunit beta